MTWGELIVLGEKLPLDTKIVPYFSEDMADEDPQVALEGFAIGTMDGVPVLAAMVRLVLPDDDDGTIFDSDRGL